MDTTLLAIAAIPVVLIILLASLIYRKYRRSDSAIHNCSQGCHHQKNVKSPGSGIVADITTTSHGQQKQHTIGSGNNKSNKGRNTGTGGLNKRHEKNQTHPWLVTSLKGHTDEVRDIGFSSNGKYLASCAEDTNNGHRITATIDLIDDVNSSSNEDLSAITSPKSNKKTTKSGRSRRQKKIHRSSNNVTMDIDDESKENRQPTKIYTNTLRKQGKSGTTPLSQTNNSNQRESSSLKIERLIKIGPYQHYISLQQEMQLVRVLSDHYLVQQGDLKRYGYPVECGTIDGGVEIFKSSFPRSIVAPQKTWEDSDENEMQISGDSGQGSSSPNSTDSEALEEDTPETGTEIYNYCDQPLAKHCDRCKRPFLVTNTGEYLTREECFFHWGKIYTLYVNTYGFVSQYMCCNRPVGSNGCARNKAHVWSGLLTGINGPFVDFVKTEHKPLGKHNRKSNVYALDCEMCFTGLGLELAKVTVIRVNGDVVYEQFVRPKAAIVDYNTRFSGISEKHLSQANVKTLPEVQKDLLELFDADTVLIGHSLENDLRALKLVHKKIVDTSILFPHNQGYPYKRKLKHLTRQILKREIQNDINGHSSLEDSRACLELTLWKVRKEHNFFQ